MKKLIVLAALAALSACGVTQNIPTAQDTSLDNMKVLGTKAVQMYVNNKCTSELQKRQEWRLATVALSAEQQTAWQNKICSCATEEAPQQLTAADMSELLTQQGREKVSAEVTVKTVSACYKKMFNK